MTTATEFTLDNDEFAIGDAILTVDVRLTLSAASPDHDVTLESVRMADGAGVPIYIWDFVSAWAEANQPMLQSRFRDAAADQQEAA
jgi:hypothetical protein